MLILAAKSLWSHRLTACLILIAIAISAVILSRLFGINGVWSSFLSSEIITFVVLLVLAKAGEKRGLKNEI